MIHSQNQQRTPKEFPIKESEDIFVLFEETKEISKETQLFYGKERFEGILFEQGFSISFWIKFFSLGKKQKAPISIFQLKRRVSPELSVILDQNSFVLEALSNQKKEKIYSEKEITANKWTHVAITFTFDGNLTDLSLFINGNQDSEISIFNFEPLSSSDLIIGTSKALTSFNGMMSDFIVLFKPLEPSEIAEIHNSGKQDLLHEREVKTSEKIFDKAQSFRYTDNFSKTRGLPREAVGELEIDSSVLKQPEESQVQETSVQFGEPNELDNLTSFLEENPHLYQPLEGLAFNFDWVLTTCSAMTSGYIDKFGKIEINRLLRVIEPLKPDITKQEMLNLVERINAIEEGSSPLLVFYYDLLRLLRMRFNPPPQLSMSPGKKKEQMGGHDEASHDFEREETYGEEEKMAQQQEHQEEQEQPPYEDPLPPYNDEWHIGAFQLVINRCHDCAQHETTTRHTEQEFVDCFNLLGNDLMAVFPNMVLVGNREKVDKLAGFDVYVRGVGPISERDEFGRYFLFRKSEKLRFPTSREIIDQIIILSFIYADSSEMERAQTSFKKKNKAIIGRAYPKMHNHPCPAPEVFKKKEKMKYKPGELDDIPMICTNWGCGNPFTIGENTSGSCIYHPGRYEFGSFHGLWPEGWTCCRGEWSSEGCRIGPHRGVMKDKQIGYCLNHGDIHPGGEYPDSFCGAPFLVNKKDKFKGPQDVCRYHSGHVLFRPKQNVWSCCGAEASEESEGGCVEGSHKYVTHPEEEAKIYFFDKQPTNPGMRPEKEAFGAQFKKFGRFSGFFRKTLEYKEILGKPRLTKEEREKYEKIDRYCLRWACETIYKEKDNDKKACRHHPGVWDFGHSGISIAKTMEDIHQEKVLWKPHWTCCRRDWEAPGCAKSSHRGIPVAKLSPEKRPYRWPDPRVQTYFRKVVSNHWQKSVEEIHTYDENKINRVYNEFAGSSFGGKIRTNLLPELLDKMNLHLLVVSGDIRYQLKFKEVMEGKAAIYLDDGDGYIDKAKFFNWWHMSAEQMLKSEEDAESPTAS